MDKSQLKPAHLRRIKSLALLDTSQLESFLDYVELLHCPQLQPRILLCVHLVRVEPSARR